MSWYDAYPDNYDYFYGFTRSEDPGERDALEAYKERAEEDMLWQD